MAHFVSIKASSAGWATGTPIEQADIWQLDSNLAKAINGDDGGAWAPTGAINIGGAYGIVMAAPLVVSSAVLTLAGTASISAPSAAYTLGAGTFGGIAQFNDGLTVTDGVVEFGGQSVTEVLGSWQFTYGFTALGDVVIGASSGTHTLVVRATETHHGTETHNGASTHNGNLTAAGELIVQGVMTYAGTAPNTIFIDDNALSVNILAYHQYIVRTLTASRSLTLTSAGALRSGTTFRVCNRYTNYSITPVVNGVALTPTGGTGYANEKTYVYDGAAWWGT